MTNSKIEKIRDDLKDLFHQFDGDRKTEFIEKYSEIWNDCYDIMEDSRYHRMMKKCVLAGFDASTAIHRQQIQKLVDAFKGLLFHCQDYGVQNESIVMLLELQKAQQALNDFKTWSENDLG